MPRIAPTSEGRPVHSEGRATPVLTVRCQRAVGGKHSGGRQPQHLQDVPSPVVKDTKDEREALESGPPRDEVVSPGRRTSWDLYEADTAL